VLAAADAGCFATYIMKQGGVLVPRKHHLFRTAYELNDEPAPTAITASVFMASGPRLLRAGSARTMKWKMVRKAVDVQEATADQGAAPLGLVAITVPC
jgi:hypothetical protein